MTRQCAGQYEGTPCRREPLPDSPGGTRHAMCADCEDRMLSVFGWPDQARAGVLRPSVVGGVPTESVSTARRSTEARESLPPGPSGSSVLRRAAEATTG